MSSNSAIPSEKQPYMVEYYSVDSQLKKKFKFIPTGRTIKELKDEIKNRLVSKTEMDPN